MARRSRKSFEGWRRRYLGDLKHLLQCCIHGRLPPRHSEYLTTILSNGHKLPPPKEVAKHVGLTNEQRERNKLWSIPPVDMTKTQLAEQRKAKDRQRKMLARRKAKTQTREAYLATIASDKPWLKEGVSRATWYRRQAALRLGSSEQPNAVRLGSSATYIN